ncbi:MAG: Crp/Fnr family transcriptional regulator [Hyphomonadaceae bacterium]|nr:Crp/Fnr family transcriptional regulator [Hyphomonadaceae bacterium]
MSHPIQTVRSRNKLLASLPEAELAALSLERVELAPRKALEQRRRNVEQVYFPESGIASVVADSGAARSIEVGMVGRDGMTGLSVLLGADRAPHDVIMQIAGAGLRTSAAAFRDACAASARLMQHFLRYAHVFTLQVEQTALANGRSKIEERLARWLLMACDRVESDILPLTHESLGAMLGVRRSGVTVALNALEKSGLIDVRRGAVTIRDRDGLRANANGAYGAAEAEFDRLFPD